MDFLLRWKDPLTGNATRVALGLVIFIGLFLWRNRRLSLPPGPTGLPVLGTLLQAPRKEPWRQYHSWSQKYGPIMSMKWGCKTVIVVTSYDIVHELLEKRSINYSSRPQSIALDRATQCLHTSSMPLSPRLKAVRAAQGAFLRPTMSQQYRPIQDLESQRVLHTLMNGGDYSRSLRQFVISIFMSLGYGIPEWPGEEVMKEWDTITFRKAPLVETAYRPTSMWAEYFPILRWLPLSWKSECDHLFAQRDDIYQRYLRKAQENHGWNWAKDCAKRKGVKDLTFQEVAHMMGSVYEGALAPFNTLRVDVLSMAFNPTAASKAQEELDRVVGPDRLPNFHDVPNLPYIQAFIKETLRWRTLSPLFIPRCVVEDDEYMGYCLPKDATVLVNLWALDHDESIFDSPWEFRPERWIENPSLPSMSFGLGHRVCPGKYLGFESRYSIVARILWAFRVEAINEKGEVIRLDSKQMQEASNSTSFLSAPPNIKLAFVPRDEQRRAVIEAEWAAVNKDVTGILSTFS